MRKMKKILALMLSVSTIISTMTALSSVAFADGKPTVRVEVKDPAVEGYSIDAKTGYTPYVVNYYISNFGMDAKICDKDTALAAISMKITPSDASKIEETSWKAAARTGKNKKANGQYGDEIADFKDPQLMELNNGIAVFSWYGKQIDPYDWERESGNEEKKFFSNIVYVDSNSSVTLTINEINIELCEYDGFLTSLLKVSKYSESKVEVSGDAVEGVITLGKASVAVTGVSVNAATTMVVGGTQQATATVTPADATNKAVTWSSSAEDVATVDQNGNITAKKAGTVTITATSQADTTKSDSVTITVSPAGPVITVDSVKGMSTDKKAAAWGLKIENFNSNKDYEATFTDGSKTEKINIPFANVTGELTVQRIIILKSDSAMGDGVTLDVVCK